VSAGAPVLRPIAGADRPSVARLVRDLWGGDRAVVHGTVFEPAALPGLLAERDGRPVGPLTYAIDGDALEREV
jgi:hypothetical protein